MQPQEGAGIPILSTEKPADDHFAPHDYAETTVRRLLVWSHVGSLLLPARVDCDAHFRRRHWQFGQPRADSALDRVGDGGHRWANVDFGGTFGAVRMIGIRHLNHDRLYHRQVG
jgi:hypothetical protein